ncbi:MAG: hypothetical protein HY318_16290, partial [Armatimonadetes bacterium]|nr:hypothetical protein [Armatimonadota bacterium]
ARQEMRCLCEALRLSPGNDEVRKSLAETLKHGLPRTGRDSTLQTLQELYYDNSWQREEFTVNVAVVSRPSEKRSYRAFCTTGTLFSPQVPQRDPLHAQMEVNDLTDAWRFNRVTYGYLQENKEDEWSLRFRVFYISSFLARSGKDYAPLSRTICRIALQVYASVKDNMNLVSPHEPDPIVDLWLCELGEAGAKQPLQAPGHIYFHDINHERVWSEWMREMAHEYGHLVLPALGGFTSASEPIANGEIGEKLFMPWIRDSVLLRPDELKQEDRQQLEAYVLTETEEDLKLFMHEGPESPLVLDRTNWGVRQATGFCLWISRTHGPLFLNSCLKMALKEGGKQGLGATELRDAYQRHWTDNVEKGLRYRTLLPIPKFTQLSPDAVTSDSLTLQQKGTTGFWVFLPEGTWEVQPQVEGAESGVLAISWEGQGYEEHGLVLGPGKEPKVALEKTGTGWHVLKLQGKNLPAPVRLLALGFRKTQQPGGGTGPKAGP